MVRKRSGPPTEGFDGRLAARLIGRTLLVGISEYEHDGTPIRRRQLFGRVVTAERDRGICLELAPEEYFWLPPDTRGLLKAKPGTYKNLATGEVVEDPDFTATWALTKAPPAHGDGKTADRQNATAVSPAVRASEGAEPRAARGATVRKPSARPAKASPKGRARRAPRRRTMR